MRIGIYDPYLDDLGGGEKYMMSIAEVLSKKHDVDVFWDNKNDIDTLLERFNIDLTRVKIVKNIFSSKVTLFKRLIVSKSYDAIVVLSDGSIPLLLCKKLYLHVQQPLHIKQESFWAKIKFSRISAIFCNSLFTKSFIDEEIRQNISVIYPPVALHPKNNKKENSILHVGRFRVKNVSIGDYKKQHIMIDTFKKMVDTGLKDWKFIVAVSIHDKDRESFEKLVENAKKYPIEFEINKSNDQLWDLYSKAKIYWHASGYGEDLSKHPEFAEHFGISTVEAMGAGVVPVVINSGGQKEIVSDGENGLLWDSLDQLQSKTLALIENPKKLEKLAQSAKKRAQDFSYKKFSESVTRLLS